MMITPDTEQVMIGKSSEFEDIWSPISLLGKSDFNKNYRIEMKPEDKSGHLKVRLHPVDTNAAFEYLDLVFHQPNSSFPLDITILDSAGSSNRLTFSDLQSLKKHDRINLPELPPSFDTTDFQGNPVNLNTVIKDAKQ